MGVKLLKCGAIQIEVRPRDLAAQWLTRLLAFKLSQPERIGNWQQGLGEELEYKESRAKVPHSFFFFFIFTHLLRRVFSSFLTRNLWVVSGWTSNTIFFFLFQGDTMRGSQLIKVHVRGFLWAIPTGLSLPWEKVCRSKDQKPVVDLNGRRDLPLKTRQTEQLALAWQAEGNCRNYSSRRSYLPHPTQIARKLSAHQSISPATVRTPPRCWVFIHPFGIGVPTDHSDILSNAGGGQRSPGMGVRLSRWKQLRKRNCGFGPSPSTLLIHTPKPRRTAASLGTAHSDLSPIPREYSNPAIIIVVPLYVIVCLCLTAPELRCDACAWHLKECRGLCFRNVFLSWFWYI